MKYLGRGGQARRTTYVQVQLGAASQDVRSDWLAADPIERVIDLPSACPLGIRLGSRILGIGIDAALVAIKAVILAPRGQFLASNPWVGVALKLLGRQVAVTGLYAAPGSASWRVLRVILRGSPVVTTSVNEAGAWTQEGGRARAVLYGNTFHYPPRVVRTEDVVRVFVGGSSDRDFQLLESVISSAADQRSPLEFVLAVGQAKGSSERMDARAGVRVLPRISQAEFGREIANADVVFLPLSEGARAAGHMVGIGALECGVPYVASLVDGNREYLDSVGAFPAEPAAQLADQLVAIGKDRRGHVEEIRREHTAKWSRRAYVARVLDALAALEGDQDDLDKKVPS